MAASAGRHLDLPRKKDCGQDVSKLDVVTQILFMKKNEARIWEEFEECSTTIMIIVPRIVV